MRRTILLLPICLAVFAALAGCGNKGPLVLPTRAASTPTPTAPVAPAMASSVAAPTNDQQP